MEHKTKWVIGIIVIVVLIALVWGNKKTVSNEPIKIGWVSALTGSVAKYGAYEAGMLAVQDINDKGGINGRKLELIVEDGKCSPIDAVTAVNKLINVDNVKVILGGHCTPESVTIAPIAEKNKVIMLASITTSPALQTGDYIFRTSPVSTTQSIMIADFAKNNLSKNKMAVIYELTDYARPIAEKVKEQFIKDGGDVPVFESYVTGTADFRTLLAKVKAANVDSLFLSAQTPDAVLNLMKQVKEMGLKVQLLGNDVAGNQAVIDKIPNLYEGFFLATPNFDVNSPKTKAFVDEYNTKYSTQTLPYGIWTAESYDGVIIAGDMIKKCGTTDTECMKKFLHNIKDYEGVSGKITINEKGDGVREYSVKVVKNGIITNYKQ